jgi:predicted RecA/RadA family phage recombinase
MKNFLQDGDVLTLPAPVGGVLSGQGMVAGKFFGVASTNAAAGASVEVAVVGVYELPAVGPIVQGGLCYWDGAAKKVTATAAGNTLVGAATEAVGGGETVAKVRLNGIATA